MLSLFQKIQSLTSARISPRRLAEAASAHGLRISDMADILFGWTIQTLPAEIETGDLAEIENPLLIELQRIGEDDPRFALLIKEAGGWRLYREGGKSEAIDTETLAGLWTGRVLAIHLPEKPPEESNYRFDLIKERLQSLFWVAVGIFSASIAFLWLAASGGHWREHTLLVLYAAGIPLCAFLTKASFDAGFAQKACKTAEGGCSKVLSSPEAKLWGWLSLGEIGLFYFSSMFLVLAGGLLFPSGFAGLSAYQAGIACVAGTFPVYSVYWQWRRKTWCRFCLLVQALILAAAALSWPDLAFPRPLPPVAGALLAFSVLSALLFTGFWKSALLAGLENKHLKFALFRFRADSKAIRGLLSQTEPVENAVLPIDFFAGNPASHIQVTIVSSPLCPSCRELHKHIKSVAEEFKEDVCFVFRIAPKGGEKGTAILRDLMAKRETGGEAAATEALAFWYAASYAQTEKIMASPQEPRFDADISVSQNWLDERGIKEVPAIFVNGRKMPDLYGLTSLRFLLRDMILETL